MPPNWEAFLFYELYSFTSWDMQFPYFALLVLGFLLSTILLFKKNCPNFLKAFSPFLALTFLIEFGGIQLTKRGVNIVPIYNIFTSIEFCFYTWVIRDIIQYKKIKKALAFLLIGFPFFSALNSFFIQGISNFNSISYSLGCLLIIALAVYYFFELFRLQYAVKLINDPGFWICTGLLFFYSVSFPIYVCDNLIKNFPTKLHSILSFVIIVLNLILYSLFCIAFLCKIRVRKSSL